MWDRCHPQARAPGTSAVPQTHLKGSDSCTSRAAPRILPSLRAWAKAFSSTSPPRAAFTRKAPCLICGGKQSGSAGGGRSGRGHGPWGSGAESQAQLEAKDQFPLILRWPRGGKVGAVTCHPSVASWRPGLMRTGSCSVLGQPVEGAPPAPRPGDSGFASCSLVSADSSQPLWS